MTARLTCTRCGADVDSSWRSGGINAVQHDLSATPDGTGMHWIPDAVLACSWNCLAILAAQRAGSDADGAVLMVAERERQVTGERMAPEHDDRHDPGTLVDAGVAYARPHAALTEPAKDSMAVDSGGRVPDGWPWEAHWWKPKGLRPDLVRAGALLAAELDADRRRNPDPDARQRT